MLLRMSLSTREGEHVTKALLVGSRQIAFSRTGSFGMRNKLSETETTRR